MNFIFKNAVLASFFQNIYGKLFGVRHGNYACVSIQSMRVCGGTEVDGDVHAFVVSLSGTR